MLTKLADPVQVDFNRIPTKLYWKNREYKIVKLGMHHKYKIGNTLFHVFSVVGDYLFFRLVLNCDNLTWQLEEVHDGLPS